MFTCIHNPVLIFPMVTILRVTYYRILTCMSKITYACHMWSTLCSRFRRNYFQLFLVGFGLLNIWLSTNVLLFDFFILLPMHGFACLYWIYGFWYPPSYLPFLPLFIFHSSKHRTKHYSFMLCLLQN